MGLIEIRDLEFTYAGAQTPVLHVPHFKVDAGERVFLHGPSGTGKTTLLEILAGVQIPQRGSVSLSGQELTAMSPAARDRFRADHVGYVFQSFNLIPYLSVEENIALPAHFSARRAKRLKAGSLGGEIARLAGALGIDEFLARPVTELSVGQQQRVAVARALIGAPELILADEPTSALDSDHRERFLKLLFDLAAEEGTTVVFVSHDRSIQHLFSRTVSLHQIQSAPGRKGGDR